MRVVVFGSTGRTGRLLVQGALARGHDVTAFARDPARLGISHPRLTVARGDVLEAGSVSDAVDGSDAVLLALGGPAGKGERSVVVSGTRNVVRSMQRYRVPRLVVLAAAGAQLEPDPERSWFSQRVIKPMLHGRADADQRHMEVIVRQSELDWTLVRAARLTDGPARGHVLHGPGYSVPGGKPISRADVAGFLLDQLERGDDVQHAVAIAS